MIMIIHEHNKLMAREGLTYWRNTVLHVYYKETLYFLDVNTADTEMREVLFVRMPAFKPTLFPDNPSNNS